MRTIYIALIFIGCLSLVYGQTTPAPFQPTIKPAPVDCAKVDTPTQGCDTCANDQATPPAVVCTKASSGYYLNAGKPVLCPNSCTECNAPVAPATVPTCTKCQDTKGFNTGCLTCKSGFTFDNGNSEAKQATDLNGMCISVVGDVNTCATGFLWSALSNLQRTCVATTTGACTTGYATDAAGKNITAITANCGFCAEGYQQVSGVAKNGDGAPFNIQVCNKAQTPRTRAAPVQCTVGGAATTVGCTTCNTTSGKCSTAAAGYFIVPTTRRVLTVGDNAVEGTVQACSLQCDTCADATSCATCQAGIATVDGKNCKCNTGYVPSIDKTSATNFSNPFVCVSQYQGFSCSTNYVWNSQNLLENQDLTECVSKLSNTSKCYTAIAPVANFDQTNVWDSLPNPNRNCVLASGKKCANGYSDQTNQTTSTTNGTKLIGNCDNCITSFSLSTVNGIQTCVQNSSSFLAMSLAFLGLLLALVF